MALTERISQEVSAHFIGDGSLLFHAGRQELYEANPTATYIWCCLAEGLGGRETAAALEAHFELEPEVATHYVSEILAQWQDLKLLGETGEGERHQFNGTDPLLTYQCSDETVVRQVPPTVLERDYRLLDSVFRLAYGDHNLHDWVHPVVGHLAEAIGERTPDQTYRLMERDGAFYLLEGDAALYRIDRIDAVAPTLKAYLVVRALQACTGLCAVHAGALVRSGRCLLMPGPSGHGKSTLTAALAANGFDLLGDDTIVLVKGDLSARAVPIGICVKNGSWDLLRPFYPKLDALPVHHRADGKIIRYLRPDAEGLSRTQGRSWPVRWMVFPKYADGAETRLTPISQAEALRRMMDGFCPIYDRLERKEIAELVTWIEDVDCYELSLSKLDRAIALLRELCP